MNNEPCAKGASVSKPGEDASSSMEECNASVYSVSDEIPQTDLTSSVIEHDTSSIVHEGASHVIEVSTDSDIDENDTVSESRPSASGAMQSDDTATGSGYSNDVARSEQGTVLDSPETDRRQKNVEHTRQETERTDISVIDHRPTDKVAQKSPWWQSKFWKRARFVIGFVVAALGFVMDWDSLIQRMTEDPSNFSHLRMSVQLPTSQTSDWAIDPDIFASGDSVSQLKEVFAKDPCGLEQQEWLEHHAKRIQREFLLSVRNVAKEGPMLALTNFRSTSEGDSNRGAISVRIICDSKGIVPRSVTYAKLVADDPSRGAFIVRQDLGGPYGTAPEVPLAFNLAPGESGSIPLYLFSRNPVHGVFRTTVLSGEDTRDIEIEDGHFSLPAMLFSGEMYLFTSNEGVVCQRTDRGVLEMCSLEELQREWSDATALAE